MEDVYETVLDTETTGLSRSDDRIVEIGCVELKNYIPTGRNFHAYIDPKRSMPAEAQRVHGLSADFLRGKPVFRQVLPKFMEFIGKRPIIAHNASFDMGMINSELKRLGRPELKNEVKDTLQIAREKRKGKLNSLDALCKFYNVDTSKRIKHGALLDAEILASVYLHLMGGSQIDLSLPDVKNRGAENSQSLSAQERPARKLRRNITKEEFERHQKFVKVIGDEAIWMEYDWYAKHLKAE